MLHTAHIGRFVIFTIFKKLASKLPLVAFVYGLAKATKGIQEVLVQIICCHCRSVYKDVVLFISLELFFTPALIGSHLHTARIGKFVIFTILKKLASKLPLVAFVYGLAKATKGIQEVLVWFFIPNMKMTYSSFHWSKLYTLEGLSKIFNSQICISHFRDAFTGFFLPLVKSRVWHLYIRNDNGGTYTEPMHLISMYASYPFFSRSIGIK